MPDYTTRVVEIHCSDIIGANGVNSTAAASMIETGLDHLSPTGIGADLIGQLFKPGESIGIKVNSLAGPKMSTLPELAFAMGDMLFKSGHKKNNITIWDRREAELARAGYKINTSESDYQCFATDTAGVGFTKELHSNKNIGSLVSRIQAELTQAVINFPILKDHSIAGLSGCLKNYYGAIHNPNKYHEDLCNPFLADLYGMDIIGGKQRLAICDATRVQINGGPGYVKRWAMDYKSILLSTDGVALDRVCWQIIDRLRTNCGLAGLKESKREPVHVLTSAQEGLGCADLKKIEWVVVNI